MEDRDAEELQQRDGGRSKSPQRERSEEQLAIAALAHEERQRRDEQRPQREFRRSHRVRVERVAGLPKQRMQCRHRDPEKKSADRYDHGHPAAQRCESFTQRDRRCDRDCDKHRDIRELEARRPDVDRLPARVEEEERNRRGRREAGTTDDAGEGAGRRARD